MTYIGVRINPTMDTREEQTWREFGRWIEDKRLEKRLSQEGAAKKAGISRQTWIHITGGHKTKRSTVIQMANAVEADFIEALSLTGFAPSPSEIATVSQKAAQRVETPMTRERFFAELVALGVEDFNAAKGIRALTPADMEEILAVVRGNARSTAETMIEQKAKRQAAEE